MKRISRSVISLLSALSILCTYAFAVPTVVNVADSFYEEAPLTVDYVRDESDFYQASEVADGITAAESFGSGLGTEESPYVITTPQEFALLSKVINEKTQGFTNAYYALGRNIDLDGSHITPIGNSADSPFSANFDGNGFTVSNFRLSESTYTGLFGYVLNGTITRLGIADFNITISPASSVSDACVYIGALAGCLAAAGSEKVCSVSEISVENGVIDITADIYNVIAANIAGLTTASDLGTISLSDCFAGCDISVINTKSNGQNFAGGIVGKAENGAKSTTNITRCYSRLSIVSECNYSSRAGGLTGYLYSDGSAFTSGEQASLAADVDIMLTNSFSLSNVSSLSKKRTSNAGWITGSKNSESEMSNVLYPTDADLVVEAKKSGSTIKTEVNTDGTPVKVSVLRDASRLSSSYGFDFENVWAISEGINDSYPYLKCIKNNLRPAFDSSMQAFLNLESVVTMSVGYRFEDMESIVPEDYLRNLGLLMWKASEAPEEENATFENCENILEGATYNSTSERFETTTDGIAAKNLGDSLTFRAYCRNSDGSYSYSKLVKEYSPKRYCYNRIENNTDEVAIALMASILNYGAAAQIYFNYNTENLMNSELSEELKVVNWDESLIRSDYSVPDGKDAAFSKDEAITARGGYLNLEGAINYNFYSSIGTQTKSATIYYWTEEAVNELSELTLENATSYEAMTWKEAKNRYEGKYEGQPAKRMFELIYALMVIEDENGEKIYSGVMSYSPERYAYMNANKADDKDAPLSKALTVYGNAAREYFKKK